jgi:hypothetical protein
LALDRFNMSDGHLPYAKPGDFSPEDRHWLRLMAKMLHSTQKESAALAAAAAGAGSAAAGAGSKGSKGAESSGSSAGAGAFSAALLVTEQDVLDVMFTVKVREGMDAVMVSVSVKFLWAWDSVGFITAWM